LPSLLQYIHRWSPAEKDKLSLAIGLLLSQGLANASCLQSLTKDHLVKNGGAPILFSLISACLHVSVYLDIAVSVITLVFRAYLADQSMDHLSATLKRGGIKDILAFFPPNKRDGKILEDHFKNQGLPQVGEWWLKKQEGVIKEAMVKELRELCEREESPEQASTRSLDHSQE
jgi:hypothetical protein